MRRNPGSARSINSYLDTIALTMEDKAYICKITKPIGWCAKFEGDDELTDDEQTQKSKILNSITKFPTVQVILLLPTIKLRRLKRDKF